MKTSSALKLFIPLGASVALIAFAAVRRNEPRPAPPAVPKDSGWIRCEGRLAAYPGADVTVGTDQGGVVSGFSVQEKETVRKGQLLARIDDREQRASLQAAEARIREQGAEIAFQRNEVARRQRLVASGVLDRRALEDAQTQLELLEAKVQEASSEAGQLRSLLAKREVRAPINGVVLERFTNAGEAVSPGAKVVRVADLSRTRIEAEVDEFDLSRLHIGSLVEIAAEGDSGRWQGRVEELPDAVGPRKLKPEDPARPTDIRVLLVKIAPLGSLPLKLGQKVELRIQPGA
ncbi:MAG TPA: efflux RND transporter periplasmic adaptor subunit [Holophagaceae bacterium]|jgi:HlyD family secretion protein|nr:efflux RND transporter periplasmic adaptor subunit [Holophagaceae bacterium]